MPVPAPFKAHVENLGGCPQGSVTEPQQSGEHEKHGPVPSTWFGRGSWATCKCGLAPRDNGVLNDHWREHGFKVVDEHGRLVCHPIPPDQSRGSVTEQEQPDEKERIIAVLSEHRGTATQFCAACDWMPSRAAIDADDLGESEQRELWEHQADVILRLSPEPSSVTEQEQP